MARAKKKSKEKSKSKSRFHPFWSGTIAFGLVSVPVQLYPAHRNTRPRLRLLTKDGAPVQRHYYCPKDRRDIHPEHIVRGFEVSEGDYVVVRDEELESLEPKKSREIDLRQFVPRRDISPAYFERAYYLTPTGQSTKAYRLLADVIEESGFVGIATFVMRDREYLVGILADQGILEAVTLRFHDELRTPASIGLKAIKKIPAKAVAGFERSIKQNAAEKISADEMRDEYATQLRKLIERKFKREEDVVEIEPEDTQAGDEEEQTGADLLETIRRSLHLGNGKALRA